MNKNVCAACNGKEFQVVTSQFKKVKNEKFIVEDESLYQCNKCGTLNALPIKEFDFEKDGDRYYSQMRLSHEEKDGLLEHIKLSQVPKYDFLRDNVLSKKFKNYKKWLDVGSCGYATTFSKFDFTTIEPDKQMVSLAKELFDCNKIFCSDLISFNCLEKFDAILFNHSFYCVANTTDTLQKINQLLNNQGIVLIGIGHIFMDAVFTQDAIIRSVEDIFVGETHKVYYSKESLEYLFQRFSYTLIDDLIVKHNIPVHGSCSRYLVFKKGNVYIDEKLIKKSKIKIEETLKYYLQKFEVDAKKQFKKFNNKKTVFIGNKNLFFEAFEYFDLKNIFGFISYGEDLNDVQINNVKFLSIDYLKSKDIENIVILDLKYTNDILQLLENKLDVYHSINILSRTITSNTLFSEIKSRRRVNNDFFFQTYSTFLNKIYTKIKEAIKDKQEKVAIFGTANAGKIAYEVCKKLNLEIECFIDDFNKSELYGNTEIPIISRNKFLKEKSNIVSIIIKGPNQKGLDEVQLNGINIIEVENYAD